VNKDIDIPLRNLQRSTFSLFFVFGAITGLNDILVMKMKNMFILSFGQVMLVQSAFFIAYLFVSIPAGNIMARIGYPQTVTVGLLLIALGSIIFLPAAVVENFYVFLIALFIVAAGVTIVQVSANPMINLLGEVGLASSRMNLAHGFNSLGRTVAPYLGASVILDAGIGPKTIQNNGIVIQSMSLMGANEVVWLYFGIMVLSLLSAYYFFVKRRLFGVLLLNGSVEPPCSGASLANLRFLLGVGCIFLYVGAEVTTSSLIASILIDPATLHLNAKVASQCIAIYWLGAMIGRFFSATYLASVSPGKLLACSSLVAIFLLSVSAVSTGPVAAYALLATGIFCSVMFPTIFTIAISGFGSKSAKASGVLCTAIVGGAFIPIVGGLVADYSRPATALFVPVACFSIILLYGCAFRNSRNRHYV
jgi:FHS family L-fucose permease-like MFS transporter